MSFLGIFCKNIIILKTTLLVVTWKWAREMAQ